jgi:serine/threonine protein phosphatase PrpC
MPFTSVQTALDTPVPQTVGTTGLPLRPDSLSGRLAGWTRASRTALPAFFAQGTQTASYKQENDDATFLERLPEGLIAAGLFDGVTVPKRHYRAGRAVSTWVSERLRTALAEVEGRPPLVENVLSATLEDAVTEVLDPLGGGAGTTATVVVAVPLRDGDWRVYTINAGNSRATLFLPDGTVYPLTRLKPPGTPFVAVNTLSSGYRYQVETSKVTAAAGTLVLLTSDGIHDHVRDSSIWVDLGRAVEAALDGELGARDVAERLTRAFVEDVIARATAAQAEVQRPDDTTALALLLGDPTADLESKRLPR